MTDATTAVANVNMGMLDRAEQDQVGTGISNVMDEIYTLKVYNPRIGDEADPEKAGKFVVVKPNSKEEELFEGTVRINPLDIKFFYAGSLYQVDKDGKQGDNKVFFSTNEFGKFSKKSDTIGLSANSKGIGFFTKGDFEKMIKTPLINGNDNQFFEKKKDTAGKFYNSSVMQKRVMVYGQFVDGPYAGGIFRMATSVKNFGITFKDGNVCDPDIGTIEFCSLDALQDMNDLLVANGRKGVKSVSPDQIDIDIEIFQKEKNFLPKFTYAGLVAKRGADNTEAIEFLRALQGSHFEQIFGAMGNPIHMELSDKEAKFELVHVEAKAKTEKADKQLPAQSSLKTDEVAEANEVFGSDDTNMEGPAF